MLDNDWLVIIDLNWIIDLIVIEFEWKWEVKVDGRVGYGR